MKTVNYPAGYRCQCFRAPVNTRWYVTSPNKITNQIKQEMEEIHLLVGFIGTAQENLCKPGELIYLLFVYQVPSIIDNRICYTLTKQWHIHNFPDGAAPTLKGKRHPIILPILPEDCMKTKTFWWKDGRRDIGPANKQKHFTTASNKKIMMFIMKITKTENMYLFWQVSLRYEVKVPLWGPL